ncbi:MAG: sigma-54-dependent Fis family transcriptional regulator [Flammeovirgaceae bacterium]|mgnify:FL=1|nr:sigma-54 dependent transcriptional regulator [Bacteroidota bacterium]GIR27014.1 MAG: sigma-54-dependent Fis family transcriptional regulator [Flammeovirgaceae bacterium]|tara:strand:- start:2 stop:1225 length:1224 start_codon:yes stop_codon:yes gene_type:complete
MLDKIKSVKQKYGIVGNSDPLNHAIQVAIQVAPTDMTVLINGESGSGKESFSKIIHSMSKRKHGEFIAVNCGAIPEGTIDSELFGHEKGSFTGANESRKGYFEVTDGGTIFLDEIGEMPLSTQSRLLRILENGEFIKVGSSKVQKTDVRIIAATNVKLKEAVEKRKFREDLYYRLNTVPIIVPPLRDRGEDISLLFRKFASDFSDKNNIDPIRLNDESKNLLNKYRFPGNIRELKNLTEQISILEIDRNITPEILDKYLPKTSNLPALSNIGEVESEENYNERDILYKILFDLKSDMNEMKKIIDSIMNNSNSISSEPNSYLQEDNNSSNENLIIEKRSNLGENQFQEVTELVNENESLRIESKERELIIKALIKNKNKRKYAAKDLGISERTLYRKIKHYNLDKDH